MTIEQNTANTEKATTFFNGGQVDDGVDTMFAPDCVDHDPAPDQGAGREGFRTFFRSLKTAFPDFHIEPATMVVTDDQIAFAYTLTGTHQGDFQGVSPTGKKIEVRGLQIGRYEDGQVVERWGMSDQLGILQQIGAGPDSDGPGLMDKLKGAVSS